MKITSLGNRSPGGEQISVNTDKIDKLNTKNSGFAETLSNINRREYHEDLQRLIKEVDKRAQKLARSCTIKDLKDYKRAVQNFLKETIGKAFKAEDEAGWDRMGRHKLYVLVKKVDKSLEELSEKVLKEQTDTLNILKKLDEIRGLLVDMYL